MVHITLQRVFWEDVPDQCHSVGISATKETFEADFDDGVDGVVGPREYKVQLPD